MPETTITNRRFAQDMRAAKTAAGRGPAVITDRGRPSHVFMSSYAEYRRLRQDEPAVPEGMERSPPEQTPAEPNLADLLFDPEGQHIEFDPPKLDLVLKPAAFD